MLVRIGIKGNIYILLAGVQICTDVMEINVVVPQKFGNRST